MQKKHFSVLVCTNRSLARVTRTIQAIRAQRIPDHRFGELWIVDNTASGETAREGERWVGPQMLEGNQLPVFWAHEPKRGAGNARNKAVEVAKGEVLIFTDDDVVPCENWIVSMLAAFDRGNEVVSGPVLLAPELQRSWQTPYVRRYFSEKLPGRPDRDCGLIGANMGFLKRVADEIGPFDPELGPGALGYEEETVYLLLMRRGGYRIGHAPEAVVIHQFDEGRLICSAMIKDAQRRGVSRAVSRHRYEKHIPKYMRARLILVRVLGPLLVAIYGRRESEGCPGWVLSTVMSHAYLTNMVRLMKN